MSQATQDQFRTQLASLTSAVAGRALDADLEDLGVAAFGEVDVVEDFVEGALVVAQANGIAGIESNMVMGW